MSVFDFSQYILFDDGAFTPADDEFAYLGVPTDETNTIGFLGISDGDSSDSASTGDTVDVWFNEARDGAPDATVATFSGFTLSINGNDYAVYFFGTDEYMIPHGGEISASDIGASPLFANVTTDAMVVNCFLAGTRIAAPDGEWAVETLKPGDQITTADGGVAQVRWVGHQTVFTRFGPAERLMPVRIRAGALGDGLPVCDLVLTADHALLMDGLLINAGALVNGTSIDYVPPTELGDQFTVYHVETERHDVILAEGAPAETYIDYVARQSFDNYAEYVSLYGEDSAIAEAPYPRICAARLLPSAIRARFLSSDAA